MKKILIKLSAFVLMMMLAFILAACGKESGEQFVAANAYLVIDINPSIEIVTNEDGRVLRVTPLNEDAQVLLLNVDLKGKTLEEAVDTIIELARESGFINEFDENVILFTVEADQERTIEELRKFLEEKVKKFKDKHQLRVQVLIEQLSNRQELIEEARELDLSVNKLALIKAAMAIDPTLTIEEARELPIKDLLKIIADAREEANGIFDDNLQEFSKYVRLTNAKLLLKGVELVNDALQAATEEELASLLQGTSATAEQVKALYQEYYEVLKMVIQNFELKGDQVPEEYELTEEGKILLELIEELNHQKELLAAQVEDLIRQISELNPRDPNFRTSREQLRVAVNEARQNYQEILKQIKDAMKDLNDSLRKPKLPRINQDNLQRELQEIRKSYDKQLNQLGLSLNGIERYFANIIRNQLEDARRTILDDFEEIKRNLKERSEAIKEELREKRENLKRLFGKEE